MDIYRSTAEIVDRFFLDNKLFNELRGITRNCKEKLAGEPETQRSVTALETEWDRVLDNLIELNHKFIMTRAKRYGHSREDLIDNYSQEGLKSLREVLRSFNPYQGVLLSSYSFLAVRGKMAKAREKDNKTEGELILDTPINSEGDYTLLDTIADVSSLDSEEAQAKQEVLERFRKICRDYLSPLQCQVIELSYLTDKGTLEVNEVAELLDISNQAVSKVRIEALKRLKSHSEVKRLRSLILGKNNY
ncbi:MAG TPA: sigma-70 family RNA polymerase sigma factor [Candidatus Nanoarchaeia archaeon]|nr:sigma-70 family RNA polymerase sigma factor [Candidatus Nanoarchaeia archaeon]